MIDDSLLSPLQQLRNSTRFYLQCHHNVETRTSTHYRQLQRWLEEQNQQQQQQRHLSRENNDESLLVQLISSSSSSVDSDSLLLSLLLSLSWLIEELRVELEDQDDETVTRMLQQIAQYQTIKQLLEAERQQQQQKHQSNQHQLQLSSAL